MNWTIAAGVVLQCPYCSARASLPHDVDAQKLIRCKCGGIASASLWVGEVIANKARARLN